MNEIKQTERWGKEGFIKKGKKADKKEKRQVIKEKGINLRD